jgi:hypothetical protein
MKHKLTFADKQAKRSNVILDSHGCIVRVPCCVNDTNKHECIAVTLKDQTKCTHKSSKQNVGFCKKHATTTKHSRTELVLDVIDQAIQSVITEDRWRRWTDVADLITDYAGLNEWFVIGCEETVIHANYGQEMNYILAPAERQGNERNWMAQPVHYKRIPDDIRYKRLQLDTSDHIKVEPGTRCKKMFVWKVSFSQAIVARKFVDWCENQSIRDANAALLAHISQPKYTFFASRNQGMLRCIEGEFKVLQRHSGEFYITASSKQHVIYMMTELFQLTQTDAHTYLMLRFGPFEIWNDENFYDKLEERYFDIQQLARVSNEEQSRLVYFRPLNE